MKSDRPSFQFYPDDWLSNSNLRRCTHEEKGAWMDILCILHDQEEYGVIRWPLKDIARAIGTSAAKVKSIVNKGVMKGADYADTVQPLIYTPRSGRRNGNPVTLIAEQEGPVWYSSRMIIDEYKRMVRGGETGQGDGYGVGNGATMGATMGAPIGVPFGEAPKGTPKPSPKGGIGEGFGEGKTTIKKPEPTRGFPHASPVAAHENPPSATLAPKTLYESGGATRHKKGTETRENPGMETVRIPDENTAKIFTENLADSDECSRQDFDQNFSGILKNSSEILKKTASEFHSKSEQNHGSDFDLKASEEKGGREHDNLLIDNDCRAQTASPDHSPKGGIGEGIGDDIGVPFGASPKLHLTLHPSRARPSSPSPSPSPSSKEEEKNIQKRNGIHPRPLPTESADSENNFSAVTEISAAAETTPRLGDQNETSAHDDASGQHPSVENGSGRNICTDITHDGNIENVITPTESATKYPEGFESFWAVYPVHNGKKPCAAVFARKRLEKHLPAILADIALRKVKNRRWMDGFPTNPLTYLNQELWTDDWASSPALCVIVGSSGNQAQTEKPLQGANPRHDDFKKMDYRAGLNPDGSF